MRIFLNVLVRSIKLTIGVGVLDEVDDFKLDLEIDLTSDDNFKLVFVCFSFFFSLPLRYASQNCLVRSLIERAGCPFEKPSVLYSFPTKAVGVCVRRWCCTESVAAPDPEISSPWALNVVVEQASNLPAALNTYVKYTLEASSSIGTRGPLFSQTRVTELCRGAAAPKWQHGRALPLPRQAVESVPHAVCELTDGLTT